jgi:hypothetical protein
MDMTRTLRRTGVIAMSVVLAALLPLFAHAQNTIGLEVKPAVIQDNANLNGVAQYAISVTNINTSDKIFYLSTKDIKGLDDSGNPIFEQQGEQTGYELSSWLALPAGPVDLKAGETKTINFSVHVPGNVSPGDHFGVIFLSDKPTAVTANGSAVGFSVGTVVSLKIAGDIHEEAQLREFSSDKTVYGSGSASLSSKIENLGNVLVRPHGTIQITDMFGRQVGTIEVNATLAPVFPGSTRKYSAIWKTDAFAFGRYEAVASFSYGDTDKKTISGTTSFWVLPLKAIIIVMGVLLALILGMYFSIRMYIRRKLEDMGVSANSSDANYYARKYQRSGSRMIIVTLVVFLVCILFLAVLFLAFA